MKVIRAADCPEMPWKNGGGMTREIAVFPPGAGMEDFLWRLSMAQVEAAGPFSTFPGIDRTLGIIEGVLSLHGPDFDVTLDGTSAPFPFDAALPVAGKPLDVPVLDLNAMVRRGAFIVFMTRLHAGDNIELVENGFLLALQEQRCKGIWLNKFDIATGPFSTQIEAPALAVEFRTFSNL